MFAKKELSAYIEKKIILPKNLGFNKNVSRDWGHKKGIYTS